MRTLAIGALACALSVSACTKVGDQASSGASAPAAGTIPGTLRIAVQRAPNTLNPILSAFTTEGLLNRLSFDVLVSIDSDGKTEVPELASEVPTTKNGGISADGLTITYHLRHNVKWQDGVPFTSRDVKFSWQAVMNPNNNVNEHVGYEEVKSVDTPDDYTVVFHLKEKFAPFVNTVFAESDNPMCVVPEHLLSKYPNINQIPFNQQPIGTGPFKVVRWVRGDHIELVANDDYWQGKPKLRTIIVREIPDENTEINSLRSHDVDWMFEPSPNLYSVLRAISTIKIVLGNQPQTLPMYFNTSRPPLDDVRVRQAIVYAIDKHDLVDKFTGGSSTVAWADQPPYSEYFNKNVPTYPPNLAKAKALLAQAGYTPGPGGILRKNGQPLTLQISYNVENVTRRLVTIQVQSDLKQVGIDAQVKAYPANIYFATFGQGGIMANAKYDLAIAGWVAGIDPDDHSLFASNQFPPAGTNYSRYKNKEMDALQNAALRTYDPVVRKKVYDRIQDLLGRDVPEDYFWFARFPQAINPAFTGFAPNPINEAWNAWQWEI